MDTPECAEQQQIAHSPIPLEQSNSDNPPSSTAEQKQIPHEQITSDDSPTAADVSVPDSTFLSVPNSSFATCKDGFESFHSCISDSSDGPCDQSDLERTVVASTPNKTRPNASHGHELIESLESLQGIRPTDSSVDIIKSNPEIPEPPQSGSITERVSYDPTPEVLKTESSVYVLEDSGEEYLPSKCTSSMCQPEDSSIDILPSSSSINVIGSSENLPDHNIKIRNSLSNDTTVSIRSSVSSIAVLGTSSQSQDFTLPYSLQEGPDSAEDEAFDEVPESSTLADEEEDEEERIGSGVLDVCQEVMTTSLETVGTEVSQEARSLETIVSPSVPSGIQNQAQCISPVEVVAGSERDCNPELNENLEVNLKKSSSQVTDSNSDNLQESQVLKDTSPSANKTEENVVPVLAKTEQTVAPATEEIEKTAAPAVQETEETAAHYVQEIEETAAPSVQEIEKTAAPSVREMEKTLAPPPEKIEQTPAPPPDEVKQATDLNQGDMENIGNFSPESSQSHEPEIVRNMYPQVVIKPSLQIAEGDIEVLKIMEPVEYSSSVESTPSSELPPSVTSREHKTSETYGDLSFESELTTRTEDTIIPSHSGRSASLISGFSVPDTINISEDHPASDLLVSRLAGVLPKDDVVYITTKQKYMLNKLECTNEKLRSCNQLSAAQYEKAAQNFKYYTRLLVEMRRDVDVAFKRIHSIKGKLAATYPAIYDRINREVHTGYTHPDEEDLAEETVKHVDSSNAQAPKESSTKTYLIEDDEITEVK